MRENPSFAFICAASIREIPDSLRRFEMEFRKYAG
jgi:hypothetical protein